jgi:hypothetical protein
MWERMDERTIFVDEFQDAASKDECLHQRVKHWRTALHRVYVYRKPISSPRSRNLKVIKKMCTFEVHLCMMSGQLILLGIFHGKVQNIAIASDPHSPFHCHACIFFLSHHCFPMSMICDWGIFFYSRDPRFMSFIDIPWFVKFSKMANFNFRESWFRFFLFSKIRDQNPLLNFSSMEKVFKIHEDLNLQTFFSSIFIFILGGICIGFALKQVVTCACLILSLTEIWVPVKCETKPNEIK